MSKQHESIHWRERLLRTACFVLFFLLMLSSAEAAREAPTAKGFVADKQFHYNEIDAVNTFNGNLVLTVPIGGSYTVGDALSYSFQLSYNSSIWTSENIFQINQVPAESNFGFMGGIGSMQVEAIGESIPDRDFNAGVGWHFSFGGLQRNKIHIPPYEYRYVYISPDGAEHPFHSSLHDDENFEFDPSVSYTRDGSYVRMKKVGDGRSERTLEFPDGRVNVFQCKANCNNGLRERWFLSEIRDRLGNKLFIEEIEAGARWQITEGDRDPARAVRTHYVAWEASMPPNPKRVKSIWLSAPGGPDSYAKYDFHYNRVKIYRDVNNGLYNQTNTIVPYDTSGDRLHAITVDLLDRVVRSNDDSTWSFRYYLHPNDVPQYGGAPADIYDPGPPPNGATRQRSSNTMGRLQRFTTPTGGGISYTYGYWGYPKLVACGEPQHPPLDPPSGREPRWWWNFGVRRRQVWKNSGSAESDKNGAEWLYVTFSNYGAIPSDLTGYVFPHIPNPLCSGLPFGSQTTVVDPLGNVRVDYYTWWDDAAGVNGGQNGPDVLHPAFTTGYGRPSSPQRVLDGHQISQEFYACPASLFPRPANDDSNGTLWLTAQQVSNYTHCGRPLKARYVKYEDSGVLCMNFDGADCQATNRRLTGEKIVLERDDFLEKSVSFSDFDGLGHFRSTVEDGNYGARNFGAGITTDQRDKRTRITNYNGAGSTCGVSPCSRTSLPTALTDWVLNRYSSIEVKNAADTLVSRTKFLFDSRGFLEAKRIETAAGSALANQYERDVLVRYTRTVRDPLIDIVEEWYGGDDPSTWGGGVNTQKLPKDSLANPGFAPQYRLVRTHHFGGVERVAYRSVAPGSTAEALLIESNEIDQRSGLITKATDSAGVSTKLSYDSAMRLFMAEDVTTTVAEKEVSTGYAYEFLKSGSTTTGARVTMQRPASGSPTTKTSNPTVETSYQYDGWGRVVETDSLMPVGRSKARSEYDVLGRKTVETTPFTGATPNGQTLFQDIDPFGQAWKTVSPDGAYQKNRPAGGDLDCVPSGIGNYKGCGYSDRIFRKAAKTFLMNGEKEVVVDELRDRYGRLVKVAEDSINPADMSVAGAVYGTALTIYIYDVDGHLTDVKSGAQQREFNYDGRGFLSSEEYPELAGGTTSYRYDSRGNVRVKETSKVGASFKLTYTLDDAERLIKVEEQKNGGAKSIAKEFRYYTASSECGLSGGAAAGKLMWALRWNNVLNTAGVSKRVKVLKTFLYGEEAGRPSELRLETETDGTRELQFVTNLEYDGLGNVVTTDYPDCRIGGCTGLVPRRSVTGVYSNGRLTAVPDFATSITYHPNGLYSQIDRVGDSHVDRQFVANGMSRPSRLQVVGVPDGDRTYAYDGSGNIASITKAADRIDSFRYDRVGRLARATINGAGVQLFNYDQWGNLKSFAGQTLSVNAGTNRLQNYQIGSRLAAVDYDVAGNMTKWSEWKYAYDPIGTMNTLQDFTTDERRPQNRVRKTFLYDADDERVAVFEDRELNNPALPNNRKETWTLRGPDHKVLREYVRNGGTWNWQKDYVYRDGSLLSAVDASRKLHYHLDHLGTPRWITSGASVQTSLLWPFGEEITTPDAGERMKFTGHERDDNNTINPAAQWGDLDYMHARYYNPRVGRFMAVDPAGSDAASPQSWNRYVYVGDDPVNHRDPDGREKEMVVGRWAQITRHLAGSPESFHNPMSLKASQLAARGNQLPAMAEGMRGVGMARQMGIKVTNLEPAGPMSLLRQGRLGMLGEALALKMPPGLAVGLGEGMLTTMKSLGPAGWALFVSDTTNTFISELEPGPTNWDLKASNSPCNCHRSNGDAAAYQNSRDERKRQAQETRKARDENASAGASNSGSSRW